MAGHSWYRNHRVLGESDEERERPRFWRFWRRLPARGSIGVMFGSWYTQPIIDFVFKRIDSARFENQLQRINEFEQMLSDDGALIIKFWFHMSEKDQRRKLEQENEDGRHTPLLKKFFQTLYTICPRIRTCTAYDRSGGHSVVHRRSY